MQFYTTYKFCAKGDTLFLKSCHIVSYCCNSVHKLYKKTLVNIFTLIQEAASCNVQCAGFNCITLHSMQDVMENKCKICSCYMFCPAWASLQKNMGNTKQKLLKFCIKICCPNFSSHFPFRSLQFNYCNLHQQVHTVLLQLQ